MNLPALHSVSFCLLALLLSPTAVTNASPPPADTVHFSCQLIGLKRSEHDQPLPATKGLADLNVGEPRTVRLIYSLPDGQPYRTETVEAMKTGILQIQSFFAEQMAAHGYGNRTFQIETDDQGEPTVHRVDGGSIGQMFDLSANIYLIVNDQAAPVQGSGSPSGKSGGSATIFSGWNWFAATHELGHAFGLHHDFRDNTYIMSYGRRDRESAQLSACTAEYLAANPHFNTDIPIEESPPPTIELISSPNYPLGSTSVPLRLRVRDGEGLYQVLLLSTTPHVLHPAYGGRELITCRGLTGQTDTVVELDYDGSIPSSVPTSLSDPSTHPIYVVAVDMAGNRSEASLVLTATSPQNVGTIEEEGSVREVVFSPNGTILASVLAGSATRNVKLWEMATRTNIGTIGGSEWGARSVAFSPNGTILASAEGPTIKLWDVQTKENIDTFEEPATPSSVAFSPDGTILASGIAGSSYVVRRESPIQLWDMTTRTNIATLERHGRGSVHSVAFSPNGQILVSGDTHTLELWDVATRTNFATIEDAGYSASISFSPDGSIIAMPGDRSDRTVIKLWDVATREQTATLEAQWTDSGWIGHLHDVYSVAFSPDGKILASAGRDRTIQLWDVATREHIAALHGHVSEVTSVAFAPAGTVLASASNDNTIKLWDTAEWAGTPAVSAPAGICDRTEEVRNAILGAISGVSDCALVTDPHLAGITDLKLRGLGITALKVADFGGLTALKKLDLARNQLSSLPTGIFDRLNTLTWLFLQHNQLNSLPADIFDQLSALTWLDLTHNQLRSLPAGIFDNLNALTTLYLFSNQLSSLPVDIFDHLNTLTRLDLNDNQLRSVSAGIFDNLNALTFLHLSSNQFSSLPAGVFDRLSALTRLYLQGNAVDPLPLTVSLEKVGGDQVKAVAPSGAPFDVVLPITVTNGNIVGGAATLTIPIGSVESEVVTVTRTPDTLAAVTVDVGTLPGLPANHSGYQLVKSVDLPLVLTEFLTPICERTPQVRDAIVAAVSGVSNCRSVAGAHLSTISELRLGSLSIAALRVGDFGGLIALTELDLGRNQLSSLPQGILDDLTTLNSLNLWGNQLSSLPEGHFDNLKTLTRLSLGANQLSSLPEGIFDNLNALRELGLSY